MSETVVVPSHRVDSHHQRAVALITMAHGFSHFYQILLPSLFVFIAPALELTYTQLGVMITLFYLASGVGQVICGFAVDRLGARRLLLFGMTLIAGAHLAAGWSTGFSALALCAFLAGVGNSVFHPADFTLLNQLVRGKRLAWAFSLHGIGGNLGYALSPVYAITAAGVFGWQVALQLVGGLGLLVALALFLEPSIRTTDSTARTEKRTQTNWLSTSDAPAPSMFAPLLNPVIFIAFCFFCVTTFYSTAISAFGSAIFRDYHGIAKEPAALMLSLYLVAQTLGMVFGGWVGASGRAPGNTAARATFTAAVLASALWFVPSSVGLITVLLCLIGFVSGIVGPSRDLLVKQVAPKEALGRAYGVVYSGFDLGAAVVPIAYGWLIDQRLAAVVIGCVVIALLVNACIAQWLDKHVRFTPETNSA